MFKKTILKNGLRIISVPQKNTQAATVLVLVKAGSKYETKETNGISHFLEHLYFKGTKKRPSSLLVAEVLDKLGGSYNAFTSEECTGYYAKVAAPYFKTALEWVSDIYLNSLLLKKEIEVELMLWKALNGGDRMDITIANIERSNLDVKKNSLANKTKQTDVKKNLVLIQKSGIQLPPFHEISILQYYTYLNHGE